MNLLASGISLLFGDSVSSESAVAVLSLLQYVVVLAGVVAVVAFWMRAVERRRLADAGWVFSLRGLGWLAVGLGASLAVYGVLLAVPAVGIPLFESGPTYFDIANAPPLWAVLLDTVGLAFVLQGIPEELLWRGWLFGIVRDRPWLAFWWTTLSFASIHLISQGGQQHWYDRLSYLAIPLGFGALAGALVLVTRSMWVAVGIHAGFHLWGSTIELFTGQELGSSSEVNLVVGTAFLIPAAVVLLCRSRTRRRRDVAPSGAGNGA
ncbi:CPBP family intramembrane glutamic endopeptidase [Pseudonocardia sp. 1LY6.1]